MTKQGRILSILIAGLLLTVNAACGQDQTLGATPAGGLTPTSVLVATRVEPLPTKSAAAATLPSRPASPTVAPQVYGPALTEVQFALDVNQAGDLVFPATEFVYGVTRVYVRFSYQELENVSEVETVWHLNENLISSSRMPWDGGESGDYIIWAEDPNGLGRGQWRWELVAARRLDGEEDGTVLGGGGFSVGGEPRYSNADWGLSFDPPVSWNLISETTEYATFSSPDQRKALALHVASAADDLAEISEIDLAVFQEDHPEAEVEVKENVSMSGESAILQQVRYTEQERGEGILFIVSAVHSGSAYRLWLLGPADDASALKAQLMMSLRSIRLSTSE